MLEINGLRYRETGSFGILSGNTKSALELDGQIVLDLVPGDYSVVLFWKRLAGSDRSWYSAPNAVDGFGMGRTLASVGSSNIAQVSVYNLRQYGDLQIGEWSDVGDSIVQFALPTASYVTLSYNLPLSQMDNPVFTSWTSDKWNRIETRLVVDGVAYRHLSSYVDGSVRGIKNSRASIVLLLGVGSHTARLQWQNVDGNRWRSVSFITDAASSFASVFIAIDAWNNKPTIVAPLNVTGMEDEPVNITGISIIDGKESVALDYYVTMRLSVNHGVLSFRPTAGITFASGDGSQNQFVLISGHLSSVNAFLASIKYQSFLNWYGQDQLQLTVKDQTSTGFASSSSDTFVVTLEIHSVNDLPQLSVPTTQYMIEDDEISIFGTSVSDADVASSLQAIDDGLNVFEVQMYAISGRLTLGSLNNIVLLEGTGVGDYRCRFQGALKDVNGALFELGYAPDRNFNTQLHKEQIGIRVIDRNARDQTNTDVRGAINIVIQSQDDPMTISSTEWMTTQLSGYTINTLSNNADASQLYLTLMTMTPYGRLQLPTSVPPDVVRIPADNQPARRIDLSGPRDELKQLIHSILYIRTHRFDGYEAVLIRVSYQADFSSVEETLIQLSLRHIDMSNNISTSTTVALSLSPQSGQETGGTTVVITGRGFLQWQTGSLQCQFGPNPSVPAIVDSDTQLVCISPSNDNIQQFPRQTYVMITDGVSFYSNPLSYTFEPLWVITDLSPNIGPVSGGTRVRLQGLHIPNTASLACWFGEAIVPAVYISDSTVDCLAPPLVDALPRTMSVRLTTNGQEFGAGAPLSFTYTSSPRVIDIFPSHGIRDGGDLLTIMGEHLSNDSLAACVFDDKYITKATYVSSTQINCVSPHLDGLESALRVELSMDGMRYTSPVPFTVYGKDLYLPLL